MTGDGCTRHSTTRWTRSRAALAVPARARRSERRRRHSLHARCGLHAGAPSGATTITSARVNRAARIMAAAHGGQVLLSQALAGAARRPLAAGVDAARPRHGAVAGPREPRARLPGRCIPALRHDFPPLRSLAATPNNLPQQVDVARRPRKRAGGNHGAARRRSGCVTLAGHRRTGQDAPVAAGGGQRDRRLPGRRLVRRARAARRCPHGAASRGLVLGVKEEAGGSSCDALLKCVKDRRLLLILDNCEHLLHARAPRSRSSCLQAGPHVKILASSREPLHVAGEATYRGAGARRARSAQPTRSATLTRSSAAVRLFVERAMAAQPSFRADDGERARRGRDLPAARRHSARDRARRGAGARACRSRRSRSGCPIASGC